MSDRLEVLVARTLDDVAQATRPDDAFVGRLLSALAPVPAARPRRRTWPAAVLVAAAVLVLALIIALLARPSSNHSAPPVHSGPPTVLPSVISTPGPQGVLQRCVVPLPGAWRAAMHEVRPPVAGAIASTDGLIVLAMTPAGDAITYSTVTDGSGQGALVLVHPNGATRTLYTVPPAQAGQPSSSIQTAQADRRWVVFDLVDSTGVRTGIRAVNLSSLAVAVLATAQPGRQLSAPQLLDGSAYWGELRPDVPTGGHVYGRNLATGHRRPVDSGDVFGPTVLGGALEWARGQTAQWLGTPHLPSAYPVLPAKPYPLVQDGPAAAWTDWDQSGSRPFPTVMTAFPDDGSVRIAFRGTEAPEDVQHQPRPFALTGNYLVYSDGAALLVLDLRTGAAVELSRYEPGSVTAGASNGVLAFDALGAKGGGHLALLRPAGLPEPHC